MTRIVEQRDATRSERKIREMQHRRARREREAGSSAGSAKLKPANAQREYYLTDIIAMAVKDKIKVAPLIAPTEIEVQGVNDKLQLAGARGRVPRRPRAAR